MELIRVQEINDYRGKLYVIRPYIEDGKIKRKTIFTGTKTTGLSKYGRSYGISGFGNLNWYQTIFHTLETLDETIDENTIASRRTSDWPIRLFSETYPNEVYKVYIDGKFIGAIKSKKALEEYEAQNAYKLSESIDRELKYLEAEKKKINDKIKELKERRKECFSKLTTSFVKKS